MVTRQPDFGFRQGAEKAGAGGIPWPASRRLARRLSDVPDATALRQTGQSAPLGQMLETAAGSGVYLLNKLVRSTLWRTVSAASKVKLANTLASGDADAVVDVLSKMGAAQVGQ
jgi:hypothetical protein